MTTHGLSSSTPTHNNRDSDASWIHDYRTYMKHFDDESPQCSGESSLDSRMLVDPLPRQQQEEEEHQQQQQQQPQPQPQHRLSRSSSLRDSLLRPATRRSMSPLSESTLVGTEGSRNASSPSSMGTTLLGRSATGSDDDSSSINESVCGTSLHRGRSPIHSSPSNIVVRSPRSVTPTGSPRRDRLHAPLIPSSLSSSARTSSCPPGSTRNRRGNYAESSKFNGDGDSSNEYPRGIQRLPSTITVLTDDRKFAITAALKPQLDPQGR
ncbi:hypothetical protein BCR39DRAFT_241556 [Naematelia encephala]|uniref:Uncharacterized protein n=1 Tax=Naematelia encephala TaxID=71784 RepID=A0A1Y2AWY7_9TREE|nr:hypothetical protein BCR39DRAFT_241556 [Naematelia encephala]